MFWRCFLLTIPILLIEALIRRHFWLLLKFSLCSFKVMHIYRYIYGLYIHIYIHMYVYIHIYIYIYKVAEKILSKTNIQKILYRTNVDGWLVLWCYLISHHRMLKCYFTIGNLVFKQEIDIPIGIDPTPYWRNLFLYFFECQHVSN